MNEQSFYFQVLGNLMHAIVYTILDYAFNVGSLAQCLVELGKMHWQIAKCTLRYPKATTFVGIKYQQFVMNDIIYGCFDVAWARDKDTCLLSYSSIIKPIKKFHKYLTNFTQASNMVVFSVMWTTLYFVLFHVLDLMCFTPSITNS